jgi:GNAT superfamily N-acetyltransferase
VIRPATEKDLDFLTAHDPLLAHEVLAHKIQYGEVYLAEQGGQRVGLARYAYFCDLEPFLTLILVLEPYRRQGIGTQLMKYWEQEMTAAGHRFLLTSTQADEDAQFFYRRLGYTDTGAIVFPGQAATELVLIKCLTNDESQHGPRQK